MKKRSDKNQKGVKHPETGSLKKTIRIATVVASLGASLGVNVGDLLASEKEIKTSNPQATSEVISSQHKTVQANEIKIINKDKTIQANEHKVLNQDENIQANEHKILD